MSKLEQELRGLACSLFPSTPDVWDAVRRATRRRRYRLPLTVAVAALVLTVALAVPPARSSLLELFHLDGVAVVRIDELPQLTADIARQHGTPTTLGRAQQLVPFAIVGPKSDTPIAVFVGADMPPQVVLVYGDRRRPRLIVSEFKPCCGQDSVTKEVPNLAIVEGVTVDGVRGLWVAGRHITRTSQSRRLAVNVLIWQKRDIIFRLEGLMTLERALALAKTLEPVTRIRPTSS